MENTAENTLLIPFSKLPKKELSQEEGEILVRVMLMSEKQAQSCYESILAEPGGWIPAAVDKRVNQILKLEVCFKTRLYILFITTEGGFSYPLTMYYFLKMWCKKNNVKKITIDTFCQNIFAMGFPDSKQVQALWDKSKVDGTPVLDIGKYCLSII